MNDDPGERPPGAPLRREPREPGESARVSMRVTPHTASPKPATPRKMEATE